MYDRNFKTLIVSAQKSIRYLNTLPTDKIPILCDIFFQECFSSDYKTMLSLFEKEVAQIYKNKDNEYIKPVAETIKTAFLTVYEFINRGMKGLLSGDISFNLIVKSTEVFEKHLKELKIIEEEFKKLGLDPNDFYESFFKIDDSFFKNNSSKKLTLNLSKHFEREGVHTERLLYYVNLKHTQFLDLLQTKIFVKNGDKLDKEQLTKILETKKIAVQHIINELYNEITDICIVNMLKTPINGILHKDSENQHNLFRRQLIIEEGSFDSAHNSFIKIFSSLQE